MPNYRSKLLRLAKAATATGQIIHALVEHLKDVMPLLEKCIQAVTSCVYV